MQRDEMQKRRRDVMVACPFILPGHLLLGVVGFCDYFRLEYTTPLVLVVEHSPTLLLYSSKLGHSTVGSTSTVITQASCLAST